MKSLLALVALFTPAMAMAEPTEGAMGAMGQIVFLGGFLVIFYFLLWRPQSKRQKEHKNLMAGLDKNDEVDSSHGQVHREHLVSRDARSSHRPARHKCNPDL